jgi:cell division protein FtsI (penicillin-binding protein 3)
MSGVVFHHIAEGVMAQHLKRSVDDARDTSSVLIPDVKNGDILAVNNVLKDLGMKANHDWGGSYVEGNPVWGIAQKDGKNISLTHVKSAKNTIPNVIGMGASDAVYLLESTGVKARLKGRGKVKSQSIHAGTIAKQGMVCELLLEY